MKQQTGIFILLLLAIIGLVALFWYLAKKAPAYDGASNVKYGPCDVCMYAKGDTTHRNVEYCPTCDAWICADCQPNLPLRAVAMVNRSLTPQKTGCSG